MRIKLVMPRKAQGRDKPREFKSSTSGTWSKAYPQGLPPSNSAMLAAPAYAAQTVPPVSRSSRPTLPPLSYPQAGSQFPSSPSSASPTSYSGPVSHVASSQYNSPSFPQTYPGLGQSGGIPSSLPIRGGETDYYGQFPGPEPRQLRQQRGQSYNPLKRPHETPESAFERSVNYWTSIIDADNDQDLIMLPHPTP